VHSEDLAAAVPLYKRALEISELKYGAISAKLAPALNNVGTTYQSLENYEQARVYHTRELEVWEHSSIQLVVYNSLVCVLCAEYLHAAAQIDWRSEAHR